MIGYLQVVMEWIRHLLVLLQLLHVPGNGTEVVGIASVVEVPTSVVEAPAEISASITEVNQVLQR